MHQHHLCYHRSYKYKPITASMSYKFYLIKLMYKKKRESYSYLDLLSYNSHSCHLAITDPVSELLPLRPPNSAWVIGDSFRVPEASALLHVLCLLLPSDSLAFSFLLTPLSSPSDTLFFSFLLTLVSSSSF